MWVERQYSLALLLVIWAIYNEDMGLYVDTSFTRTDIIRKHCRSYLKKYPTNEQIKKRWKQCRKNGDRAVKVKVSII